MPYFLAYVYHISDKEDDEHFAFAGEVLPVPWMPYFPEPVFSHGQLYVAHSRATSMSSMRILSVPDKQKAGQSNSNANFTKNMVYKEVLNVQPKV